MNSEGRAAALWLIVGASLVHLVLVLSLVTGFLNPLFFEASRSHGQAGDFFGIYQAGVNVREGRSIYARTELGDKFTLSVPYYYFYRYPPPTALVFAPLSAALKPWPAYWAWVAFNEALLLIAAGRVLRLHAGTLLRRAAAASLWLAFTPFYLEQFMGQFSFSMGLLIAVMLFSLMPEERGGEPGDPLPARASVAWVGSLALKSYTALFAVPLLIRRRWKTVLAGGAAAAVLVMPYYAARPHDLVYFLRINLKPFQEAEISGTFGFHAFLREVSQAAFGAAGFRKIAIGPADLALANLPVVLVMALVFAVACWVTWRSKAPLVDLLSLWVLAFFLMYKEIWEYHYVMLLPVLTVLTLRTGSLFPLVVWILLALPTPYALYAGSYHAAAGRWDLLPGLVHFASKSIPTLALFVWAAGRLLRADLFADAMAASARKFEIGSRQ